MSRGFSASHWMKPCGALDKFLNPYRLDQSHLKSMKVLPLVSLGFGSDSLCLVFSISNLGIIIAVLQGIQEAQSFEPNPISLLQA